MRTDTVLPLARQSMSFSAWMMFLRACSLSGGATASSMSRKTKSAALVARLGDHVRVGARNGQFAALQALSLRRWWIVWLIGLSSRLPGQAALAIAGHVRQAEMLDRRADARAGRHLHAAVAQRHFGRRQRAARPSPRSSQPRWPMRNTLPATLLRPTPSEVWYWW